MLRVVDGNLTVRDVVSLDQRRQAIYAALERTVFEVGEQLLDAKRDHPRNFQAWVTACLPFGQDKAERLMAIAKAFRELPAEKRGLLPPAWSALFELSRMPSERFQEALEAGTIHPKLTIAQSRAIAQGTRRNPPTEAGKRLEPSERQNRGPLTADLVAKALVKLPRAELSPLMEQDVRLWLESRYRPTLT